MRYTKYSPYARKVFKHIRRIRGKDLCVHGDDAKRLLAYSPNTPKRHKSVYIFVNNNTNSIFLKILSNYTIWDRLSQKTISRYCPFKCIKKGYYVLEFSIGVGNRDIMTKELSLRCLFVLFFSEYFFFMG